MSLFSILFALLLEQVRPITEGNWVHVLLRSWANWLAKNFDAGQAYQRWLVWGLSIGVPTLAIFSIYWILQLWAHPLVATLWSAAVLYYTVGFRQFSHHFTGIRDALDGNDELLARARLAAWQRVDASALPRSEIVRHVIEYSVLAAHRHVFGVLAWFCFAAMLGFGPAGAVFYRMSEYLSRGTPNTEDHPPHATARIATVQAARAWCAIDWLPIRITSLCFAVVGNFEEAIDYWRHYAHLATRNNDGLLLAVTAGAVGVQLGGNALQPQASLNPTDIEPSVLDSESTRGQFPETAHLAQVVGLVWRSVVVWVGLVGLLTLAKLLA